MIEREPIAVPRWRDYVLFQGPSFHSFWRDRLSSGKRDVLFILGKGFDPRTCLIAEALTTSGGVGRRDCLAFEIDEGAASPSAIYRDMADENWEHINQLFKEGKSIDLRVIQMWDDRQRRVGSRTAGSTFESADALASYTDVVIDISALPRDVYFPLIGNIMAVVDYARAAGALRRSLNIHVCVAENALLDSRIVEQGIDDVASLIHGFGGGLDREATANLPRVWIPLLGENQKAQLERIRELVKPVETCPALPFPALNPRRGDNIVREYHDLLFTDFGVDPRNFVFVSERNPFEVYRRIRTVVLHYQRVLKPLGGCRAVLSALSSKLLSLGALLVAYELLGDVAVAHVGSQGFRMAPQVGGDPAPSQSEMFGLWLVGECYET